MMLFCDTVALVGAAVLSVLRYIYPPVLFLFNATKAVFLEARTGDKAHLVCYEA